MMVVTSRASLVTTGATAPVAEEEEVDESKVTGDSGIMMVPILPSAPCYG